MNVEMWQLGRDVSVANCLAGQRHMAGGIQVLVGYTTLNIVIYRMHYYIFSVPTVQNSP